MDIPINAMLSDMGIIDPESQETAIERMKSADLISKRRKRANIASAKRKAVESCLKESFAWRCNGGDCKAAAQASGRPSLAVDKKRCSYCNGSSDEAALRQMAEVMASRGLSQLLVVGGTDKKWQEIKAKSGGLKIEWRFIDGTVARDDRYYRSDRNWANIIVIWSSTPLDHRVSKHFTGRSDDRVITADRRSIAALCQSVIRRLQR